MICEICMDFTGNPYDQFSWVLSNLQPSCRYCSLLRSLVEHFAPPAINFPRGVRLRLFQCETSSPATGLEFTNDFGERLNPLGSLWIYRKFGEHDSLGFPGLGGLPVLSSRSDSEQSFQFLRNSLQGCSESHPECLTPGPISLPKRVLDVGSKFGDAVRLIETKLPAERPYAALSHCWGDVQPLQTTLSTLSHMRTGIPWPSLSRVFQDSITVCRNLGIPYLWIDSLCIIQDSTTDWEVESSKMCDYYSGAYLTIAASVSENGNIPFLTKRTDYWMPHKFAFHDIHGNEVTIWARRWLESLVSPTVEQPTALSSRAWCWQEHVLSSRIIHYTASCLMFECRSGIVTEDNAPPGISVFSDRLAGKVSLSSQKPGPALLYTWQDLVRSYAARELTCETDKLPALSGVANAIVDGVNCRYLAGLWERHLAFQLCWFVDYHLLVGDVMRQPKTYIAPTWSWASLKTQSFSIPHGIIPTFTPFVKILDAQTACLGFNPFGEVTDGHLSLRSATAKVQISARHPTHSFSWYACIFLSRGRGVSTEKEFIPDCVLSVDSQGMLRRARNDDEVKPLSGTALLLMIGKRASSEKALESRRDLCGIVVSPFPEKGDGHFTRIGLIQIEGDWFREEVETEEMTLCIW